MTLAPCGVDLCGIRMRQELESSYLETSSLSWSWLTFRVLTTDQPALRPQTPLPRQRGSLQQSAPPMNISGILRRISASGSDQHRIFHNPTVQRPRPWVSASRPWSSTRCSATSLPTL